MAQKEQSVQGAADWPPLLHLQRVTTLTDAAMSVFVMLHQAEKEAKQAAKARLKAEMDKLDLFGLTANRTGSEAREYQPDEDRDWCP